MIYDDYSFSDDLWVDLEGAVESVLEGQPVPSAVKARLQACDINVEALSSQVNDWHILDDDYELA